MNNEQLEKLLNEQLNGKQFGNYWDIENDIGKIFNEAIKDTDLPKVSVQKSSYSSGVYFVRYKDYCVCEVEVHKTRGNGHWSCFSSHQNFEWFYKSFTVCGKFDYAVRVEEIETEIAKKQRIKKMKDETAYFAYYAMRKAYSNMNKYDFYELLDDVVKGEYRYEERYNEENKEAND